MLADRECGAAILPLLEAVAHCGTVTTFDVTPPCVHVRCGGKQIAARLILRAALAGIRCSTCSSLSGDGGMVCTRDSAARVLRH